MQPTNKQNEMKKKIQRNPRILSSVVISIHTQAETFVSNMRLILFMRNRALPFVDEMQSVYFAFAQLNRCMGGPVIRVTETRVMNGNICIALREYQSKKKRKKGDVKRHIQIVM